ncbi:MAG TPA: (2Fe-2S)-binding protein [Micromonosporaceae bacterium]|jgi:carbon-monoxide dehydrogenase small subunit
MHVSVTVDGKVYDADDVWAGESLLRLLRDRYGLRAVKSACEQGECGSCTVRLNGVLVNACLILAAQADGLEVDTAQGLSSSDDARALHPIQRAFIEAGAVQCGFCTTGMMMAAEDLLRRIPQPTESQIRSEMSGNLCRCTGYQAIVDAVLMAAADAGGTMDGRTR